MTRKLLCIIILGIVFVVPQYGQVIIYGKLKDKENGAPISYVQVVLYRYKTSEVVAFQLSDEQGNYRLTIKNKELAFTLKTNSLTHKNLEKDIVLDVQAAQSFQIDLELEGVAHTLTEVKITGKLPPLIVKKDTIIYNISHWQDEQDQSLEAVLAKIPGFEVLSNGELKVNGKQVQKVLVNGEEISDAGAAMLTRNLTPDRVKSVEVRFDEKDEKIKESLLSSEKFVVLDIKLKEDQNQSFFGRAALTAGIQAGDLRPGASLKSFILKKAFKTQLLGEYEAFGDKTIHLSTIQNLGAEAYAKIFDIPADFSDFRNNPEFNNEIYGFREYTHNQTKTFGINSKIDFSPKLELFLGSYLAVDKVRTQNDFNQFFFNDSLDNKAQRVLQNLSTLQSKSKAELVLTQKNSKLKYNFNVVFSQHDRNQDQKAASGNTYEFTNQNTTKEFYHNLFYERRFSEKNGLQINGLYSSTNREANWGLTFQDIAYAQFFSTGSTAVGRISQVLPLQQTQGVLQAFYQHSWKNQVSRVGLRLHQDYIKGEKKFNNGTETETLTPPASLFNAQLQSLNYSQVLPYLEQELNLGALSIQTKLGWAINFYPELSSGNSSVRTLLEWNLGLSYPLNELNTITASVTQNTSAFPLRKMIYGQEMVDFQTILIPNQVALRPQQERLASFSFNTFALQELGMVMEFSAIAGKALNSAAFGFNEVGFVEQYIDQLPSHYYIGVVKLGKVFNDFPVQIKLEPNIIYNKNTFRNSQGNLSFVATQISTLHLRFFSDFKKQTFDFESGIKLSDFKFSQKLEEVSRKQEMLNLFFKYKQNLLKRKLQGAVDLRYTIFNGSSQAKVLILDAQIRYVNGKTALSWQLNNLFNARRFVQQSITPAFFMDSSQYIFGRYGKMGLSFDLN